MIPQLRDHATIAKAIIDHQVSLAPEITDYVEGSIARSFDDAVAVVQQGIEYASFDAARQAILAAAYASFQFPRLPAVFATGLLRFTRAVGVNEEVIAAGFQVRAPGSSSRIYEVMDEATLDIGVLTLDIPVRCLTVGIAGNTAANTITEMITFGFSGTVTNLLPFLSGQTEETDDARFQRFQLYIGSLSRGTVAALEAAARGVLRRDAAGNVIERAVSVHVKESYLEDAFARIGLVNVYVDNGSGTVSADLKDLVRKTLQGYTDTEGRHPGYVAAGIDLQIDGVAAMAVSVECGVLVAPTWEKTVVLANVEHAIINYLNGLPVFAPAIHAELIAAVMNVDGVVDVVFYNPTANVTTTGRVVAGTVVVNDVG